MAATLDKIIIFALIPFLTILVGGVIAIIKPPKSAARSVILHFAAGVVFSVVAVEILPDIVKLHSPGLVAIGFTLGVGLMLIIKKMTDDAEAKAEAKAEETATKMIPFAFLLAIGVDVAIDGLLLGIGFAAGSKEGMMLAFALAMEFLSLGMATASKLGSAKLKKSTNLGYIVGLGALFFVFAVLGGSLLNDLSHDATEIVLSFGLAALLYLVTEELLVEAHEEKDTAALTGSFFAGFLLFLILGMIM